MRKKKIAVYIVTCFVMLCIFFMPTKAEESYEDIFLAWMKEHRYTGGTFELEDDLYLTKTIDWSGGRPSLLKDVIIRTNGYHIYVKGTLDMSYSNHHLTIEGEGGEEGLLQVQEGGTLYLGMLTLNAEDDGYVLVQQEGGILVNDSLDIHKGRIQYAKKPVITFSNRYEPRSFIYQANTAIDSAMFPQEFQIFANYQGILDYSVKAAVDWPKLSALSENKWHSITASPIGYLRTASQFQTIRAEDCYWLSLPEVRVMVTKSGVGISKSSQYLNNTYQKSIALTLIYAKEPEHVQVLMKQDRNCEWKEVPFIEYAVHDLAVEGIEDGAYLCVEAYYNNIPVYSNVIQLQGAAIVERDDIEGNRGGGIPLQPSEEETEKEQEGEDTSIPAAQSPSENTAEKPSFVKPPSVITPIIPDDNNTILQLPVRTPEELEPERDEQLSLTKPQVKGKKKKTGGPLQSAIDNVPEFPLSAQTKEEKDNQAEILNNPPVKQQQAKTQTAAAAREVKEKQRYELFFGSVLTIVILAVTVGSCFLIKKRKGIRF